MPAAVPLIGAVVGAVGGWGTVIGVASFVASTVLQRQQAAKARRQARRQAKDAAGINARISPSGDPVDIAYGRFGMYYPPVFAAPSASAGGYANEKVEKGRDIKKTRSPSMDGRQGIGSINSDNVETDYQQFLMCQYAGPVGQIKGYTRFLINDSPVPGGKLESTYILEYSSLPHGGTDYFGVASPMAMNWNPASPDGGEAPYPRRTESDRFSDLSYITAIFFQGESTGGKAPQYGGGIPQLFVMGEGRLLRDVVKNEADLAVIAEDREYENNPALVLLDYSTSELPYGPGLDVSEVNLDYLAEARDIMQPNVFGPGAGDETAALEPEAVEAAGEDPDRVKTGLDYLREHGYAPGFSGLYWPARFWGGPQAVAGARSQAALQQRPNLTLKQAEFNGIVPTLRDYNNAIDQILAVYPGSFFFLGLDGTYKLVVGDHTKKPEEHFVAEIDEKDTVNGINEVTSSFDERYNQIKISFANQDKDFAADTVNFPRYNSTIHRRWIAEDGGRILRVDDSLDGVSSTPQAQAIARMEAALSRRAIFEFTVPKKYLVLEPGDIISLNVFGRGQVYARIEMMAVTENLMVNFAAREYSRFDFQFWVDDSREVPGSLADRDEAREPGDKGPWTAGSYYVRNDWVFTFIDLLSFGITTKGSAFWRCLKPHYSSTDNMPGTAGGETFWVQEAGAISGRFDFVGDRINDVVFVKSAAIEPLELPAATKTGVEIEEDLAYTVTALPEGLVFNPTTREITGTPQRTASLFRVEYTATLPSTGETAEREFHITIREKGSRFIPTFELTAIDTTPSVSVIFDWQVLKSAGSIVNWRFVVTGGEDSKTYAQETLSGEARRKILTEDDGVVTWPSGLYTVSLRAVLQDGVVTEADTLTFHYISDSVDLLPAATLEITDIDTNELTATWDVPEVPMGSRVSKYENRYRISYNAYILDEGWDRRNPGTMEQNAYAFLEDRPTSIIENDADLTMTHVKDTTHRIRLGQRQFPIMPEDADQDQQSTYQRLGFFRGQAGFARGDFVSVRIENNWVQFVFDRAVIGGSTPGMNWVDLYLQGEGSGATWKPTVENFKIDPDNQHISTDAVLTLQAQGRWKDSIAINEASATEPPEAEYVFQSPAVRLNDGIWYDHQWRFTSTSSMTNSQGQTVETSEDSDWSQVATIFMSNVVPKPPLPRNIRLQETTQLLMNFDTHPRTSFDVDAYQIRWKSGDDDYPSSPQITVTWDEDRETYSAVIAAMPATGTYYAAQIRTRARREGGGFDFSDWSDEHSTTFGVAVNKLAGFLLQTGDNPGEVKYSFPAPANMSEFNVEIRRASTTSWDRRVTMAALESGSDRSNPVAQYSAGTVVSGVISGLTPGVVYEATGAAETFEDD